MGYWGAGKWSKFKKAQTYYFTSCKIDKTYKIIFYSIQNEFETELQNVRVLGLVLLYYLKFLPPFPRAYILFLYLCELKFSLLLKVFLGYNGFVQFDLYFIKMFVLVFSN